MRVIKVTEDNRKLILDDANDMVQRNAKRRAMFNYGVRPHPFAYMLDYYIRHDGGKYYGHYYPAEDDCSNEWHTFLEPEFLRENYIYELPKMDSAWFQATHYVNLAR